MHFLDYSIVNILFVKTTQLGILFICCFDNHIVINLYQDFKECCYIIYLFESFEV